MKIRTNPKANYLNRQKIIDSIMHEAKILDLQPGAIELSAKRVASKVEKWAKQRSAITQRDLELRIAKELAAYNADLAYIYKNRGKII